MKQYLPALCSTTPACQTPLTLYSRVFNHVWLSQTCFNTFLTTILTRKFQLIQQEPAQLSCLCVGGRTWDPPPGSESVNSLGGIVLQHLFSQSGSFSSFRILIFHVLSTRKPSSNSLVPVRGLLCVLYFPSPCLIKSLPASHSIPSSDWGLQGAGTIS